MRSRRRGAERVRDCDVLIIGSGAGGSAAAFELTMAGYHVTVLEEGPRVSPDEIAAAAPSERVRRLYRCGGLVQILGRPAIAYGEGRCVGGTTEIGGGVLQAPTPALLARWARESGIGGYDLARLAPHLNEIIRRLGGEYHTEPALPGSANRSMSRGYLPDVESLGGAIVPETRASRIEHVEGIVTAVLAVDGAGEPIRYQPRSVFVAAGPLRSPALLRRSRIHCGRAGRRIGFHVDLRTVARFAETVHEGHRAFFTTRLGDRETDPVMTPCDVTPGGLAAMIAGRGPRIVERVLADIEHVLVVTTRVRITGDMVPRRAHLGSSGRFRHAMTRKDFETLTHAFGQTARLMMAAGASEIIPPVSTMVSLRNRADVEAFTARVAPGDWALVSVQGMSSCPMATAERGGVCDERGRPYGFSNLRICDASVLPGTTGVNPQGTIMAYSHEIACRFVLD